MENENKDKAELKKEKWWQWVLAHPAIAVALIGVLTTGITIAPAIQKNWIAYQENMTVKQVDHSLRRQAFMQRAITEKYDCVSGVEMYAKNPENIEVDATLCDETGDIFLRVNSPRYGRNVSVVFLDDHIKAAPGQPIQTASFWNLVSAAHAGIVGSDKMDANRSSVTLAQTQVAITICQRILPDNRTLIRRVQQGSRCTDEYWDTFSGQFIRSQPAVCAMNC